MGNTVVVFWCSCCSFYSFFSCLVCLFSFATFSTFSSRYYRSRSPLRVCRVRATLHHSRANPPSLSSGCHRQPEPWDHREPSELTLMKPHVIIIIMLLILIKLLFLTSHLPKQTACEAEELQRRMLSPQHHQHCQVRVTTHHTASGFNFQNKFTSRFYRGKELTFHSKSTTVAEMCLVPCTFVLTHVAFHSYDDFWWESMDVLHSWGTTSTPVSK